MRTLHLTGLALAIATGFALPLAGSAEAAMGGALPSTQVLPVEQAQFFFLGHNFCWYDDGWQGPGWYWCNYAWRSGYGWGGGDGWHGWNRGQWHGNRGPVGRSPNYAPQSNVVRSPQQFRPMNNVVRTPQIKSGAFHHGAAPNGAGPKGGAGPGARPCPQGKC
jgi:hypothetical protein